MSSDWTCHVKKEFFNNKSPSVWIKCSLSFHSHAIRYKWIFSLLSVLFCLLFCLNAIVDVVNQSPNSTHMWMCCWLYIPSDSESLMISNWCHCHLLFHFLRAGHGWFNVGRLSIGKKVVANWQFVTSPRTDDEASLIERHPMASNDEYYEYMESQIQSLMIADDDFIKTMNPCLNINLCTTPWIKPKSRATAWRPIKS